MLKVLVRALAAFGLLASLQSASFALSIDGHMTGGGLSATSCSYFLEDLATARLFGLDSDRDVNTMFPWLQHMTGFVTGFNLADPGMFDLVASARYGGMNEVNLTLINLADRFCRRDPTASFSEAMRAAAETLYSSADKRPT